MKWNVYPFALFFGLLGLMGCNTTGAPVDFAHACDKPNDGKNVEVTGYFKNTGSAMCSKSNNGPMRCPINFVPSPDYTGKEIRAHIEKGDGKSEINAAEGKPLEIHDATGAVVENSQKVKLVARVKRLDAGGSDWCYIDVKKIEKAP